MRIGIIIALLMGLSFQAAAQDVNAQRSEMLEIRREVVEGLRQRVARYSLSTQEKEVITQRLGIPMVIDLDSERQARFQYLDEDAHPVYFTTHNVAAAATNGVRALQAGGSLNLGLAGQGMVIGIYDQTRPRANHNEFGNRVTQIDGSTETLSNHATHVTGTILARGNNPNARGMANEATGWAFNWDADISKMLQNGYDPDLLPTGHLVSNHSYGILVGWFRDNNGNWAWSGNESVSPREDYRFGFYTNRTRQIDEVAFAKPYYTVVWAAGNDRNDVGDGSRDSDGPDDSIGPEGVAKNNIVVGAVNSVTNYTGPQSVVMSPFSSWGPVDDGRIKPDLVAMGVNVFSSSIINDGAADGYASLSGTSMAAPNVSGAFLLLQELYRNRNAGRYMRSATVKALAIHTAREAGMNDGPDYMFGWGLLDAEASARMIIDENGSSRAIRELTLENSQTYEFEFISDGIEPVIATIAWTDPPGTSPAPSLNPRTPMLVNDLDMRIIGEDGTVFFPWSLNPNNGVSAVAARNTDNTRDNVEKIEIRTPISQRYTVRVTHKRNLQHGRQPFSLVLSAGVIDGQVNTLYWIGQNAGWNNPNNWSLSSNGPPAGLIPGEGTRVVIDRPVPGNRIALISNTRVFSLNVFGSSPLELDLAGNELIVESGFRSSNAQTRVSNGSLVFDNTGTSENVLDFGQVALDRVGVRVRNGRWRVLTAPTLSELALSDAEVDFDLPSISVGDFTVGPNTSIQGRLEQLVFSGSVDIAADAAISGQFTYRFTGANGSFNDGTRSPISGFTADGGIADLQSIGIIGNLRLNSGSVNISQESVEVNVWSMIRGVELSLADGSTLRVASSIQHDEVGSGTTRIRSSGRATITHPVYRKYCFRQISVTNVDLAGDAIINLGPGASISNSANWLNISCDNVLFPNFEVRFSCVGGLTEFVNLTEGTVTSYSWNFGNLGSSTAENPTFMFNNARNYTVTLLVRGPGGQRTFQQNITVTANSLRQPEIVVNGSQLTSLVPASRYQWYRNGVRLPNATSRSLMATDGGSYQVAVIDDQCNRLSSAVVISSLEPAPEPELARRGYSIGPNPFDKQITVTINNDHRGMVYYGLYSSSGVLVSNFELMKNQQQVTHEMEMPEAKGLYLMIIRAGAEVVQHKLVK
ncbi:MAG: S8 family serine peptidase [Lunatimonas sp.]|uniref:S8 family serine peptidase n=1 Tax=Lunatimonas sp. TaxID=2060141 RepID=UPI00263B6F03|nr:S8 family serine peptidase [Lunatimonas sp.]MCC5936745.1 S8 family serine peptidase [Lunatimonas sp.]